MTPAKKPFRPTDADVELITALTEWKGLHEAYKVAYDAEVEGRKRLVAALKAAGVTGLVL